MTEKSTPRVVTPEELNKPPPHPYAVGLKQLVPLGIGTTLGFAAGLAAPHLTEKYVLKRPLSAHETRMISSVAGSLAGVASAITAETQKAVLDRAIQEYKNFPSRRARDSQHPTVQPPPIH